MTERRYIVEPARFGGWIVIDAVTGDAYTGVVHLVHARAALECRKANATTKARNQ